MTRPGPELVIFDCDGVLVDSEWISVRVDVEILGELGWPISQAEVVERFVGRSEAAFIAEVEDHLGRPLSAGWDTTYTKRYADAFDAELTAVDGVVEALDALDAQGRSTCVASSGSHEKMRGTLGRTGLYDRLAGRIFSASEVANGKPAPDLFLHAAARMGIAPRRCVVVEDSPYGIAAAHAAGMHAFAYAGGLVPLDRLEGPSTTVFSDMRELPALVASAA